MARLQESLLRGILAMTARQALPPERLAPIVAPGKSAGALRQVYNLCDGSRTQREVAKAVGLDQGNLSRTIARWVEQGVVLKFEDGRESKYLHLYPLDDDAKKKRAPKK